MHTNTQVDYYVEQLQALLMADLAEKDETTLYGVANDMIKWHHPDELKNICQAYEIVKHQFIGH